MRVGRLAHLSCRDTQRTINHKNSRNCVLFETIRLVIHYDTSDKLLDQVRGLLAAR